MLTLTLTIFAVIALLYVFKSHTLIFIVNVKYKSAFKYSLLKAITFFTLALSAILSFSFNSKYLLDSSYKGDITYYTAGLKAYESTNNGDM